MLRNLVLASCTNSVSTIPMRQFAAPQGLATLSLHFTSIILRITGRQRNQALCWNYSARFFDSSCFIKNFVKTVG